MRVYLEHSKCKACGLCSAVCPQLFDARGRSPVRVRHEVVPGIEEVEQQCRYAAEDCPAGAIHIIEGQPAKTPGDPRRDAA